MSHLLNRSCHRQLRNRFLLFKCNLNQGRKYYWKLAARRYNHVDSYDSDSDSDSSNSSSSDENPPRLDPNKITKGEESSSSEEDSSDDESSDE
jgi:hypothetical protein